VDEVFDSAVVVLCELVELVVVFAGFSGSCVVNCSVDVAVVVCLVLEGSISVVDFTVFFVVVSAVSLEVVFTAVSENELFKIN
jgi:hypothetical protein